MKKSLDKYYFRLWVFLIAGAVQGRIQKIKKGGPGPRFWKEGAGKRHLNVHFSKFSHESFVKFSRKGEGAASPAPRSSKSAHAVEDHDQELYHDTQ